MKIGMVTGEVPLRRSAQVLENARFVTVKVGLDEFTALDLVEAQAGDMVLVQTGEAAAKCAVAFPVDAAVVGIL